MIFADSDDSDSADTVSSEEELPVKFDELYIGACPRAQHILLCGPN